MLNAVASHYSLRNYTKKTELTDLLYVFIHKKALSDCGLFFLFITCYHFQSFQSNRILTLEQFFKPNHITR